MSLITTCPSCNTSFHLRPEHLNARGGYVRCGKCQQAFKAAAFMREIEPLDATAKDEAIERGVPVLPFSLIASHGTTSDTLRSPAPPADNHQPLEDLLLEPTSSAPGLHPALGILAEPASHDAERPDRTPAWLWLSLTVLLLLLAGAQAALHYRTELTMLAPSTRPLLVRTCAWLGCSVGLPRNDALLSIDDSDLREDENHAGVYILTSKISNLAKYAQAYPQLELTLTDVGDLPLARRTLSPDEYLPVGIQQSSGFPASSQIEVRVFFRTEGIHASGYRVFVSHAGRLTR